MSITPTKMLKKLCDVDKINKDTLDRQLEHKLL